MLAKAHDQDFNADVFNIRETGNFCTNRLRDGTADIVTAYFTIGRRLADLRGKLKKTTPRGDNEHVGWKQAFKQKYDNDKPVFPFNRATAEKYIKVHESFGAMALAPNIFKQLPSGLGALLSIVDLKLAREQIEQAITDKRITFSSEVPDIKRLAKSLGLIQDKKTKKAAQRAKPKRERIAKAFEMLAALGLSLDDLIRETEEANK